jgi:hypothetical protein
LRFTPVDVKVDIKLFVGFLQLFNGQVTESSPLGNGFWFTCMLAKVTPKMPRHTILHVLEDSLGSSVDCGVCVGNLSRVELFRLDRPLLVDLDVNLEQMLNRVLDEFLFVSVPVETDRKQT